MANGSDTNYFAGTSSSIDQVFWDDLPNHLVAIQLFALEEVDNLGTAEIMVVKQVEEDLPKPAEPKEFTILCTWSSSFP